VQSVNSIIIGEFIDNFRENRILVMPIESSRERNMDSETRSAHNGLE
jgi:hypothetical protein